MPMYTKIRSAFLIGIVIANLAAAQDRPKIGLALGAGGAKGMAHIPVMKLLDELDIPIDYIAGTSIGGVVGALYALGYTGEEIETITVGLDWDRLFRDRPPRTKRPYFNKKNDGKYQLDLVWKDKLPSAPLGLVYGQNISLLLHKLTFAFETIRDFDHLPIPFRCMAVDLVTGQEVVLKEGSLARALRATIAIPTVFSPVSWGDHLLVDGGILNTLPVDVCREMGADIVIAVELTTPLHDLDKLDSADTIFGQSVLVVEHAHKQGNAGRADILIHPDMTDMRAMDFFSQGKLKKIKDQGEIAAENARPHLIALKKKYTLSRSKPEKGPQPAAYQIGEIAVMGQDRLTDDFMLEQFAVEAGDRVTADEIESAVQALYALGYFESLQYELLKISPDLVKLELHVKELPAGRVRLGLRYDNLHKLVGIAGIDFSNVLFSGLRFENELQVSGVTQLLSRVYYPSRTLNLPLYPVFEIGYRNTATRVYDGHGDRVASYNDRAWRMSLGIGLLPARWLNAELGFQQEYMNIRPTSSFPDPDLMPSLTDRLSQIVARFTFDALDEVLLPEKGVYVGARYEGSYAKLGSDVSYDKVEVHVDGYLTFAGQHTGRIYLFYGQSGGSIPFYKYFNLGRPRMFVGMHYDQLYGSRLRVARCDYRFKYNDYLNFSLMGNIAFDFTRRSEPEIGSPTLWGFGFGLVVDSPVGIVELIYALGSKSFLEPHKSENVTYLTLGTRF